MYKMKIAVTIFLLMIIVDTCCCTSLELHTDVVLFGALGDLSNKYLWQSFFQLFLSEQNNNKTFSFYGISRDGDEEGSKRLSKILDDVSCKGEISTFCGVKLLEFRQLVEYVQLKTENQFQMFGKLTLKNEIKKPNQKLGRIFYLALPPNVYSSVAGKLSSCCKLNASHSWSRLVLEKPFGSDLQSALAMATEIGKYFTEEEIYRVDHYLAKSVVKQILPFRTRNAEKLESILNNEQVERIEIAMKETIDVRGRIEFYDKYGVIRDVMQNHLTELLALVTMELPNKLENDSEANKNKNKLLTQVEVLKEEQVLTGQYSKYLHHAEQEKSNISVSVYTPTFAAALLNIDSPRWHGVPIIMMSGKALDERSSYIRIIFKDNIMCVCGCKSFNVSQHSAKQIIFQINPGSLPTVGILVSKNLFSPQLTEGLEDMVVTSQESFVFGQSLNEFYFVVPKKDENAYVTVVRDLYLGDKKSFVTTEGLQNLWKIWSPVVEKIKNRYPRLYLENNDVSLNFHYGNKILKYVDKKYDLVEDELLDRKKSSISSIPSHFLGHMLHVKPEKQLYISLAENIYRTATETAAKSGGFHIALSGGTSSIPLYRTILKRFPKFPWKWTHIWQVDERCVPYNDQQSNFRTIDEELLQHIQIPFDNIHIMRVDIRGILCSKLSEEEYEAELIHHISKLQMDFIILGMGQDGHTASLFPSSALLKDYNKLVAMTTTEASPKRMTLLYSVINKAKNIAVIVNGHHKHDIVDILGRSEGKSVNDYPILGVNSQFGNVTFYIDNNAWFGK
ncbi:GDH/6PGL endoplasmic bifunctional protein-like [Saccostrea echinata]|uniref:GDH/6PGL endoplasmic bifunctional protein-like n=1 Tax=Saccostrea echinata TaxID=191078 RepID=UPI002A7F90DB|nr:GDH/6PGL endoplasmic bifunctional protein-like [Saccostrea echinata]